MITVQFPIDIDLAAGLLYVPSMAKLQEVWLHATDQDKDMFAEYFDDLGVDVYKLISQQNHFNIVGEIPVQDIPKAIPAQKAPVHSYYYEQAEMMHKIQRDVK